LQRLRGRLLFAVQSREFRGRMDNLKGARVAILVDNGFKRAELTEPAEALDQAGADTKIVSPQKKKFARGKRRNGQTNILCSRSWTRRSRAILTRQAKLAARREWWAAPREQRAFKV
ncbi:MAG TPA: hypothetical protein VJS43_14490, partial [Candidatus Acidoferrales bacterium]|nr:hypothetical protein [Candidatus Acidoferrales bacterium]